jgi:molybdate transport system permease protein
VALPGTDHAPIRYPTAVSPDSGTGTRRAPLRGVPGAAARRSRSSPATDSRPPPFRPGRRHGAEERFPARAGPFVALSPLLLSFQVAGVATTAADPGGRGGAWWSGAGRPFRGKALVVTLLTDLPLVLPPTVVGFALLLVLGRGTAWGRWLNDAAGVRLLFTWEGAALAAAIMALPLFVKTAAAAFASVDADLVEAGRTLGAGEATLLWRVLVPLSHRGLLAGATLAFARALGEFGATLMVAGSIPGRTQTLPLALYAAVQAGKMRDALVYATLLFLVAFLLLAVVGTAGGRIATGRGERV